MKTNEPTAINEVGEGSPSPTYNVVILGVGNLLLSDEGVGVHAAQVMEAMSLDPEITVIEGGTDGFGLIHIISDTRCLIVIDCVKGGAEPGSIYKFTIDDVPDSPPLFKTSVHQIGILEVVHMAELIGVKPKTTIIGVEPECLEMGMTLSPTVAAVLPKVIELAMTEAQRFLVADCSAAGGGNEPNS